jgi:hypothetical protein
MYNKTKLGGVGGLNPPWLLLQEFVDNDDEHSKG